MLKKPPVHRVDAAPVLIVSSDGAWDTARIERELAEVAKANEGRDRADRIDLKDHPFARYQAGLTRMDLDARSAWRGEHMSAADYLLPDQDPTRFCLRRLRWAEYHKVMALLGRGKEAALRACQMGLVEVENGEALGFDFDPDARERSDEDMQVLHDFSPDLAVAIGHAVIAASLPLTDAEKKR